MKPLITILITLIFYFTGVTAHDLAFLDGSFGLPYYLLDRLGIWQSGPYWVIENRSVAIFLFFIFPLIVSLATSSFIVWIANNLRKRSAY